MAVKAPRKVNKASAKAMKATKSNAPSSSKTGARQKIKPATKAKKPKLLSGGNPQIPKGDGDAPVKAYIAAVPGWKRAVAEQVDALIVQALPQVQKAVKWNTPFYKVEGKDWFAAFHCYTKYIKVTFFNGTSLSPLPSGESKQKEVRYLDIYEDKGFDEAQFTKWVKQASKLPGMKM